MSRRCRKCRVYVANGSLTVKTCQRHGRTYYVVPIVALEANHE